jgi:hypothetical protein
MPIPVDSSRSPLPPVAQVLAEAALQRQNMLLGTGQKAPAPLPADGAGPTLPGVPPGAVPPPLPIGAPVPAATERVSISPEARQSLQGAGNAPGDARTARAAHGPAASSTPAAATAKDAPPGVRPSATAAATAVQAASAWPASGVSAPVRSLVAALVQQLTAPLQQPQRVAGIQPWSADLVRQVQGESGAGPQGADPALPPLQTWRVAQGTVQTAEGPRGFALTLRVPVAWLASQPLGQATTLPAAPLQAPFTGNPQALQSGVFALVLEGPDTAAPRTSALLVLDMAPQQGAAVYGREQMLARMDPWTQMAVLQASGQLPVDEDRERDRPLCEVAGCPYAGRSPCAQPFCLALRWVDPVVPSQATGS